MASCADLLPTHDYLFSFRFCRQKDFEAIKKIDDVLPVDFVTGLQGYGIAAFVPKIVINTGIDALQLVDSKELLGER